MNQTEMSPAVFFNAWKCVCESRTAKLRALWSRRKEYTSEIFYADDSVVGALAAKFSLVAYNNYYSLDTIFFGKDVDQVHCAPTGQTWVQNIRIAFEHEHIFRGGLYQEVSHLMITRARLRVLVTYPGGDSVDAEFTGIAKIISAANLDGSDPAFLIITGERTDSETGIAWRAYIFQDNRMQELHS